MSLQSCPTLCDPIDVSPPGSPAPGILQARTLEWVAIYFSNAGKWKVKVKSLSRVQLLATPWTAAHQAPPSMGFSRQECWSGVPLPSPPYYISWYYKLRRLSSQKTGTYPSLSPSHPTLKSVTLSLSSVYLDPLHFSPSSQPLSSCPPHFTRLESSPSVSLFSIPSPTLLIRLLTLLKSWVIIDGSSQSDPKPYAPALIIKTLLSGIYHFIRGSKAFLEQ